MKRTLIALALSALAGSAFAQGTPTAPAQTPQAGTSAVKQDRQKLRDDKKARKADREQLKKDKAAGNKDAAKADREKLKQDNAAVKADKDKLKAEGAGRKGRKKSEAPAPKG
jgi:hypothetical protein